LSGFGSEIPVALKAPPKDGTPPAGHAVNKAQHLQVHGPAVSRDPLVGLFESASQLGVHLACTVKSLLSREVGLLRKNADDQVVVFSRGLFFVVGEGVLLLCN